MIRAILIILNIFLFWTMSYAGHSADKRCSACHSLHKNGSYKLLTQDAINNGEAGCYICHRANSISGAPNTEQEFTQGVSRHPLASDKECFVCHLLDKKHNDEHLDRWPNLKLKDPDPQDSHNYSGAKINDFCLSCHDNSPVGLGNPPRFAKDLSSAYEFTGHGKTDINEPCDACHEHHASLSKPHLIKDVINTMTVTGNDNSVCFACHSYSKDTYPGKLGYLSSEHGMQGKLCVDCHNPHGDNKDLCYLCHNDKYSSHYSAKRDKLCVDCHNPHQKGDLKMTRETGAKLCYLCHQELKQEFGSFRDGASGSFSHHKVDDEEYGGGKIKCTDCHNPHIVTKLNIVSPSGSGGSFSTVARPFPKDAYKYKAQSYDEFCLACHDGSRILAKDIKAELNSESIVESGFTQEGAGNLHKTHKNQGFGCQNCHDAHSSSGTSGIKRGSLLNPDINVKSWDNGYREGKSSCSGSSLGLGCH